MSTYSHDNKRIASNTLFLYCRSIFIILIALYTTRITLEVLGETNYGIYNIVGGTVALFSLISSTMINASQRFITFALGKDDKKTLKTVFDTCVSLHIVVALILLPILEGLGVWLLYNKLTIPPERLNAAFWVLQCSIFTLMGNIISIPFSGLIIAHEKMSAYAYISIIEAVLKLTGVILLQFFFRDKLIAYAVILASIIVILQLIYSIYSHHYFEESRNIKFGIKGALFKEMFAFSGWNLIGSGSLLLRNQGVDVLLNIYFGVGVNAAKGICSQVQNAVTQFVTNFQTALNPQIVKSVAKDDYLRGNSLIMEGGRYSFYLMSIFSVPIIINCSGILGLWLKEIPGWTEPFIQWTLIYCLWDCLSRLLIMTILATGKIRNYQILVGGTKMMALPVVWLILWKGGSPLTGILVNIGIELICLIERLIFTRKATRLSPFTYLTKTVARSWIIFCIAFFVSLLIRYLLNPSIFTMLPISVVVTIGVIAIFGLNSSEKTLILNMVKSKMKKV